MCNRGESSRFDNIKMTSKKLQNLSEKREKSMKERANYEYMKTCFKHIKAENQFVILCLPLM